MRKRIQLTEKDEYVRIVARVPADLEHACRRLARSEGWILGDLCRSLIVLAACGSYLALLIRAPAADIGWSLLQRAGRVPGNSSLRS